MVASFFTPEHVESIRPFIRSTVDETLQSLAAKGGKQPVDLVENFSLPIPSTVRLAALGPELRC
jgi:cytochrome P450